MLQRDVRFLIRESDYAVFYIFFMYRTSELKNILIFINFLVVIQNTIQNQVKYLVRIKCYFIPPMQ